ncbi:hypothetical protein PHLCEN_2v13194 [Hermanssonia centrifuga]|uniref:Uncharacterized protein n=1 Tax=Hermanssonia centrifuga TaxID=98765 RepID=A0A2R6NG12_9APHY|nr:hypothetical protein PHLCEN_2v13194 [Hermanssonia centrifuga]
MPENVSSGRRLGNFLQNIGPPLQSRPTGLSPSESLLVIMSFGSVFNVNNTMMHRAMGSRGERFESWRLNSASVLQTEAYRSRTGESSCRILPGVGSILN